MSLFEFKRGKLYTIEPNSLRKHTCLTKKDIYKRPANLLHPNDVFLYISSCIDDVNSSKEASYVWVQILLRDKIYWIWTWSGCNFTQVQK
jgi:hypothetical protein